MTAVATAPDTAAGIASHVREAREHREALRIAGAGHWLDAGRPTSASSILSLQAITGIVDYNPGDLTLTARAGTSLDAIARAAAAEHQWLALDPFGAPSGTLGATVATASAGPLAFAFGTPRDNVLGLEIVTGDGRTIRSGGRVVKNVAGFDLTRLFTGSWGTLGVITEVTVRLRALPEVDDTLAISVDEHPDTLGTLLLRLRTAAIAPIALELVNAPLAHLLGLRERMALLIRLGGNADSVRAQRAALGFAGQPATVPASVWNVLRACEPEHAMVMRISMPPSRMVDCWTAACDATRVDGDAPPALVHGTPERGVVRCIVPAPSPEVVDRAIARCAALPATVIFERLPAAAWARVPDALRGPLAPRVRQAFDPDGILNPGILGATR
ncbi:MAG TPA: FAD-binding oxidoreductase [Gemmatimonadaceae bacterium]|jgi:glycolate oxidase FAD binding subunit